MIFQAQKQWLKICEAGRAPQWDGNGHSGAAGTSLSRGQEQESTALVAADEKLEIERRSLAQSRTDCGGRIEASSLRSRER